MIKRVKKRSYYIKYGNWVNRSMSWYYKKDAVKYLGLMIDCNPGKKFKLVHE